LRSRASLTINLDGNSRVALHRQLYQALRIAIGEGSLAPGALMPSTRGLARCLAVSRNTVLRVYEELASEGLLVGRMGSGTTVRNAIPRRLPDPLSIFERSQYPLNTMSFLDPEGNVLYLNQNVGIDSLLVVVE